MLINKSETINYLCSNDNYLILTHKKPDGDTVGSAAALCRALRKVGKRAYVLQNSDITPRYEQMIRSLHPTEDFSADHILAVDIADVSLFPKSALMYTDMVDLSIDHHDSAHMFSRMLYNNTDAAATGEMIVDLIHALGAPIGHSMANALYTAISTDTGCFRFANTTPTTHRIVAELMECGADWYELNRKLFSVKTPTRLAVEGAILRDLTFFCNGQVSVAVVSQAMRHETGATEDDLDGISSLAYQIDGIEAGITVFEQSDGYKISMRTGSKVDASKVCALFGGGGHNRAAGCFLSIPLEDVISKITSAVCNALNS